MTNKVVLVCGLPASGKTTAVQEYLDQGYFRLNRDELGGKIADLVPKLESLLNNGQNVVLDNLFTTSKDRKPFVDVSKECGAEIIAHFVDTPIEECQVNACTRMAKKYGHVLTPQEIKDMKGKDPNTFPPAPLFKANKALEKPSREEGFTTIVSSKFKRIWSSEYRNKALILDYDGTLRETVNGNGMFPTKVEQVKVYKDRGSVLKSFKDDGYLLLGASNQSGIAKGNLTHEDAKACFDITNEILGVDIEYLYDASRVPPVTSWSRKPMPGMGVYFIEKYKLNPSDCIMVGDMTSDKTFATRCDFKFEHAERFFNGT
jgi:HAD superfamily hydrolase (TIGR01662 family)